ncbi:MAG: hypothetical protein PVG56_00845, partial [Anaerolineae bacterium]
MGLLTTFFSTLVLAAKRLWNHRLLMLCLLAGLVAAVALLSSIPMYAEAVHHQLLQGELTEVGTYRPPFAFLWRYVGTWHGDIGWDEYTPANEYLSQQASGGLGLPLELSARHARTGNLRLFAATDSQAFEEREPLMWTSLGFITVSAEGASGGLEAHVELVEGAFPQVGGEDVGVLVSQALAEEVGLQVGERYVLFGAEGGEQTAQVQVPVRVAGVWRARDPGEAFWFYQPASFDEVLLTSEAVYAGQVVPMLEAPVSLAVWYQVLDGDRVRSGDVPGLLGQVVMAESRAAAL